MIFKKEAKWIASPTEQLPVPYFRKDFILKQKVQSIVFTVSALGSHVIYIDGKRIDSSILNPRYSDNRKTVYVNRIEVDQPLNAGKHTIGVCLGRSRSSMITQNTWGWHNPPWDKQRKFIFQMEITYSDGSNEFVFSNSEWTCAYGPLRFDCLYTGETYDANFEFPGWNTPDFKSDDWLNSKHLPPPEGQLVMQKSPTIQPIREIEYEKKEEAAPDVILYSFKENVAGNAIVRARGKKGSIMTIHYGEKLFNNKRVDSSYWNIAGMLQLDKYTFKDDEEIVFEPLFSYKGFRYIEIRLDPDVEIIELKAFVYHNKVTKLSDFSCSNPLLEKINENAQRALLSNAHHIPTDTPIYEKNGWTGDAQLTAPMAMYNFGINDLYSEWLDDFADAQAENGEIPPIVPSPNWGYSDSGFGWKDAQNPLPIWDYAYFEIPRLLHLFYGNRGAIEKHYPNLVFYINYLSSTAQSYIIKTGLGDWLPPLGEDKSESGILPDERNLTSTAYYFKMVSLMVEFAQLLGKKKDVTRWQELAQNIKTAFNKKYLDTNWGIYLASPDAKYRQTPNIIPLAFGMVPEEIAPLTAAALNHNIIKVRNGRLWTGIAGTRYILEVLCQYGYTDTAYGIISSEEYPSLGYWIKNGASSLYENWELDTRSRNHHMYGSLTAWFYSHLAGIIPAEPGFKSVYIKPYFPSELNGAKASRLVDEGEIYSSWKRLNKNTINVVIKLPDNIFGKFVNTIKPSDLHDLNPGINELTLDL